MSDEYDEIRAACDDKIAAAMRRVAELKTELAAAQTQIAALREFAEHLLVVHEHREPLVASTIVDLLLKECGK